jgi:uncharacterized protein with PQ loop repeat
MSVLQLLLFSWLFLSLLRNILNRHFVDSTVLRVVVCYVLVRIFSWLLLNIRNVFNFF